MQKKTLIFTIERGPNFGLHAHFLEFLSHCKTPLLASHSSTGDVSLFIICSFHTDLPNLHLYPFNNYPKPLLAPQSQKLSPSIPIVLARHLVEHSSNTLLLSFTRVIALFTVPRFENFCLQILEKIFFKPNT